MYYSKSKNAFYADDLRNDYEAAGSWPSDAIEITDAEYAALMAAQAAGQAIQADASGNPVAVVAPAPTLDQMWAAKLGEINAACDAEVRLLRAGYPDNEVQSWDKQEREAEAFTANNTASTPLLSALASARGIALSDLAARVMQKAAAFAQQSGTLIGKRQALEDQLNTISDTDPDAAAKIAAINW